MKIRTFSVHLLTDRKEPCFQILVKIMKIKILKNKIQKGLSITERIVAKSLTLPILNNILFSIEKNFLNLTATDLEIGIKWWSLAKVEKEGKIIIPGRVLSQFLTFLPDKPVEIKIEDFDLNIECDNYKTQIKGLNPEEFPIIPKIENGEKITVNSQLFCESLSKISKIPSVSSIKPEISGIFISFSKKEIKLVATDSFRLGEKIIPLPKEIEIEKEKSLIIPQKTAEEIINIFSEKETDLNIYISSNQIMFESLILETTHPEVQLTSLLIEGDYPDYEEIIPKKNETKIIIPTKEFLKQIKAASLFGGKINEIKLQINPSKEQINFSSNDIDLGKYESFLNGKIEGKKMEISFNHKFLIDGLNNIKSSEVILELNGDSSPGLIKPVGDTTYMYVIMPIKAD